MRYKEMWTNLQKSGIKDLCTNLEVRIIEGERERESAFSCWFTPLMTPVARLGLAEAKEPGTASGYSTGGQGHNSSITHLNCGWQRLSSAGRKMPATEAAFIMTRCSNPLNSSSYPYIKSIAKQRPPATNNGNNEAWNFFWLSFLPIKNTLKKTVQWEASLGTTCCLTNKETKAHRHPQAG